MTVVLLHALPLDERMWESQREVLAADTVVTPRLYELGSSMDEWAEKILDRVEGRFAAIGASMGGYCALAIARRAPERVSGLGLVGSRAEADPSERLPVRERWLERIAAEGAEGIWAEMGPTVFGNLTGDIAEWVRSLALAQDPEGLSHAVAAIRFGQAVLRTVGAWRNDHGLDLEVRVGMASGPVVGGVIGQRRILFDLWGGTVNTASRMESSGVPGRIQVAASTRDLAGDAFAFEERTLDIKGLGQTTAYVVSARSFDAGS